MLLVFIKIIYVLINVIIGVYDFSFYRIPNILLAALLVLYGVFAPLYMSYENILIALAVFAVVLLLGFILYTTKMIGGGDAKYVVVISLWAGFPGVMQLILIIAFVGGVVAIFYLFFRDHIGRLSDWVWDHIQKGEKHFPVLQYVWIGSGRGPEMGKRENISSRMIPYGIAIAIGAIIMMNVSF